MKISKTHQKFSEHLNQPDALTNPEKYLGPNWLEVLNFWIYLDTLSNQDKEKIYDLYWALDDNVRISASIASNDAAEEVVDVEFSLAAWYAAYNVATGWVVFGWATCELIGSHKLLDQNKTPAFLPLCVKP